MTVPSNLVGSQPKCLEIIKAFVLLIIIYCFYDKSFLVVSVQSPSHVRHFGTLWTVTRQVSLSFTISQSSPKFMLIASVMLSNYLTSDAFFSFCPQSFPVSGTFPMSHLFTSDDQNTGASVLASEKAMATHSSVLAWRIPGTGEPGGLPSMRSHRVGHN